MPLPRSMEGTEGCLTGRRRRSANELRFHGLAEIFSVHGQCNVQRTEVAGDVLTDGLAAEVSMVGGDVRNLQDLGAQVAT